MDEAKRTSNVLVVEDDDETREMLVDILRHRGFSTHGVDDGAGAIDRCVRSSLGAGLAPRVVLLDLMLPDMHGLQVADAITRSVAAPPAFIVLSAQPQWAITRAARAISAFASVRKPFDVARLVDTIERASRETAREASRENGGVNEPVKTAEAPGRSGVSAELLVALRSLAARRRPLSLGPPDEATWNVARRVVERATRELGRAGIAALSPELELAQTTFLAMEDVEHKLCQAHVSHGGPELDFAITDAYGYALLQLAFALCRHLDGGPEGGPIHS